METLTSNYTKFCGDLIKGLNDRKTAKPLILVVSKKQSLEKIEVLYELGQRAFGENTVQELEEKSLKAPKDIKWHFIGRLQSNKCSKLLKISNLDCFESLDSRKLAIKLNETCERIRRNRLDVLIQVNADDEKSKNGVAIDQIKPLAEFIFESCPRLRLKGLMAIGSKGTSKSFHIMREQKLILESQWREHSDEFRLSMGMSKDYVEAIKLGSNEIRIGTAIFGARDNTI